MCQHHLWVPRPFSYPSPHYGHYETHLTLDLHRQLHARISCNFERHWNYKFFVGMYLKHCPHEKWHIARLVTVLKGHQCDRDERPGGIPSLQLVCRQRIRYSLCVGENLTVALFLGFCQFTPIGFIFQNPITVPVEKIRQLDTTVPMIKYLAQCMYPEDGINFYTVLPKGPIGDRILDMTSREVISSYTPQIP